MLCVPHKSLEHAKKWLYSERHDCIKKTAVINHESPFCSSLKVLDKSRADKKSTSDNHSILVFGVD